MGERELSEEEELDEGRRQLWRSLLLSRRWAREGGEWKKAYEEHLAHARGRGRFCEDGGKR